MDTKKDENHNSDSCGLCIRWHACQGKGKSCSKKRKKLELSDD